MKRGRPPKQRPIPDPPETPVASTEVPSGPLVPPDWRPGMLLNVRNAGDCYRITLYPEEYDPRHPERTLRFPNPADCQKFVSLWYSRQSPDPRAR